MNTIKTSVKKSFLYILTLTISSTLLFGCTKSEEEINMYEEYVVSGDEYYTQRDYSEAISSYNSAIEIDDTKSEPYFGIMNVLVSKNRLSDVVEIIEQSAVNLPKTDKSRMYAVLGNAYYDQGNWNSAETMYLKASNGVDNVPAWLGLAKVYIKRGEFEKVTPYLKVTSSDTPGYYETSLLKGYLAGNDKDKIKEAISGLEKLEEENAILVAQYESLFKSANDLAEDDLLNIALLSKEYINAGYPYLAISMLEERAEDMIEYSDGLYFLGRAYFEVGKYSEAIDTLSTASTLGLNSSDLYLLIARSYYLTGNVDKSVEIYERAIQFTTEVQLDLIAKEYSELLYTEELFTKLENLLDDMEQDKPWVIFGYVDMYYAQKNKEKVVYYLDELNAMELEVADELDYLAWEITYYLEEENYDETLVFLDILKGKEEYNSQYYLLLGRLHFSKDEFNEASDALELAIEYDLVGEVTVDAKKLLERI